MARRSIRGPKLKTHGSLNTERTAVRQSCNAGEGFRKSHGFLGNFKIFSCNCPRGTPLPPGRDLKNFCQDPCIRADLPCPMPCKGLRRTPCRALKCDLSATREDFPTEHHFVPAIPALQQGPGQATRVKPGHRLAAPALPGPGTIWPKPLEIHGDSFLSTQKYAASIRVAAQTYTRRQYNACSHTIT